MVYYTNKNYSIQNPSNVNYQQPAVQMQMEEIPSEIDEQTLYKVAKQFGLLPPEDIDPKTAVEEFHEEKESEVVASTIDNHETRLGHLVEWCEDMDIDSLADLTEDDLENFKDYLAAFTSPSSLEKYLITVRQFIRYCDGENWVESGLQESVPVPDLDDEDEASTESLAYERTKRIVEYLDQYEPYTCEHVIWTLLAEAGLRISTLRALDVKDFLMNDGDYFLSIQHRPEQGTRLKNQNSSERTIRISEYAGSVIEGYLNRPRENPVDDYGREALLSVGYGRISKSTIRKYVYRLTEPCQYTGECPHGKDLADCQYRTTQHANGCPSSKSPHPVRRGYLTEMRRRGCPPSTIEHRCDVSERVVEKHYDVRSEFERARTSYQGLRSQEIPVPFSPVRSGETPSPPSATPEGTSDWRPEEAE